MAGEKLYTDGEIKLHLAHVIPKGQPVTGNVPIYYYRIRLLDDTEVGRCDLRIGHNAQILIAGHIGYSIWQEHRGHHYAAKACRLLMQIALAQGMDELIITCEPKNIASRRTCEAIGAKLQTIIDVPKDSLDYALGCRQKCQYKIALTSEAVYSHGFFLNGQTEAPLEIVPRLYAQAAEKICLTFSPLHPMAGDNPQWADWHSYRSVMVVYLSDYRALLLPYITRLFPLQDPINGAWQETFDECFDNWLDRAHWQQFFALIKPDILNKPNAEQAFYQQVIQWLTSALHYTDIIVVEGNI